MDADGGTSKHPTNKGGAKYGTGYCDAQCPHDVKWINGKANSLSVSVAGSGDAIWERHYHDHRIADDDEYTALIDYLHGNPVRHGLCQRASDWQWSSVHRFVASGFKPPETPLPPPPRRGSAARASRSAPSAARPSPPPVTAAPPVHFSIA